MSREAFADVVELVRRRSCPFLPDFLPLTLYTVWRPGGALCAARLSLAKGMSSRRAQRISEYVTGTPPKQPNYPTNEEDRGRADSPHLGCTHIVQRPSSRYCHRRLAAIAARCPSAPIGLSEFRPPFASTQRQLTHSLNGSHRATPPTWVSARRGSVPTIRRVCVQLRGALLRSLDDLGPACWTLSPSSAPTFMKSNSIAAGGHRTCGVFHGSGVRHRCAFTAAERLNFHEG